MNKIKIKCPKCGNSFLNIKVKEHIEKYHQDMQLNDFLFYIAEEIRKNPEIAKIFNKEVPKIIKQSTIVNSMNVLNKSGKVKGKKYSRHSSSMTSLNSEKGQKICSVVAGGKMSKK